MLDKLKTKLGVQGLCFGRNNSGDIIKSLSNRGEILIKYFHEKSTFSPIFYRVSSKWMLERPIHDLQPMRLLLA